MEKRTVLDALSDLAELVETSDTPRESAMLALGFVLGMVIRCGWSIQEIIALRAWPARQTNPERDDNEPKTVIRST